MIKWNLGRNDEYAKQNATKLTVRATHTLSHMYYEHDMHYACTVTVTFITRQTTRKRFLLFKTYDGRMKEI